MSSILFCLDVFAFVAVAAWMFRVERRGRSAEGEGLLAMKSDDAAQPAKGARGPRWKAARASIGAEGVGAFRRAPQPGWRGGPGRR